MSRRIIIESPALRDLEQVFDFIANDNLDAARRFLRAWQAAFERLAAMPSLGPQCDYGHPELHGMRVWPIPKFPRYLIFYRAIPTELVILRVLHGARDIQGIFDGNDS